MASSLALTVGLLFDVGVFTLFFVLRRERKISVTLLLYKLNIYSDAKQSQCKKDYQLQLTLWTEKMQEALSMNKLYKS